MQFVASLVLSIVLAGAAEAQILYQTRFDDSAGWTLPAPNSAGTAWKVDDRPAAVPFGAYRSAPASLNYNNDVDYAGPNAGPFAGTSAVSPPIDLGQAFGVPTLVFWCNNRLQELLCDNHESVVVRVRQGTATLLTRCLTCGGCYQNMAPISPCDLNAWHQHSIALDPNWGVVSVQFTFRGDAIANETEGLFIDDLLVAGLVSTGSYCSGKLNSQGCVASVSGAGTPDVSSSAAFTIAATNVLNQKSGLLFYGLDGRNAAPFLGGTMCVRPPLRRTPVQSSGGSASGSDCSGVLLFDFNAWARSAADPALTAGAAVAAQYRYRDPADPHRMGLSDALEFSLRP